MIILDVIPLHDNCKNAGEICGGGKIKSTYATSYSSLFYCFFLKKYVVFHNQTLNTRFPLFVVVIPQQPLLILPNNHAHYKYFKYYLAQSTKYL